MTKTLGLKARAVHNPYLLARVIGTRSPRDGEMFVWTSTAANAWAAIFAALDFLDEGDYNVLIARFGEAITLQEYGARIERSRERVRQIEARALRRLRFFLRPYALGLQDVLSIHIVPDGLLDPAWITVRQAGELTGLSSSHIRFIVESGRVKCLEQRSKRAPIRISRESLKQYVFSPSSHGRKRGLWRGE